MAKLMFFNPRGLFLTPTQQRWVKVGVFQVVKKQTNKKTAGSLSASVVRDQQTQCEDSAVLLWWLGNEFSY